MECAHKQNVLTKWIGMFTNFIFVQNKHDKKKKITD